MPEYIPIKLMTPAEISRLQTTSGTLKIVKNSKKGSSTYFLEIKNFWFGFIPVHIAMTHDDFLLCSLEYKWPSPWPTKYEVKELRYQLYRAFKRYKRDEEYYAMEIIITPYRPGLPGFALTYFFSDQQRRYITDPRTKDLPDSLYNQFINKAAGAIIPDGRKTA